MCWRFGVIKLEGADFFSCDYDWGLEIPTYLHYWLSLLIKNDVFPLHQNNYNLRNCQLFECNPIAVTAIQLLKKVLNHITLHLWSRITKRSMLYLQNCKTYISNIYIYIYIYIYTKWNTKLNKSYYHDLRKTR